MTERASFLTAMRIRRGRARASSRWWWSGTAVSSSSSGTSFNNHFSYSPFKEARLIKFCFKFVKQSSLSQTVVAIDCCWNCFQASLGRLHRGLLLPQLALQARLHSWQRAKRNLRSDMHLLLKVKIVKLGIFLKRNKPSWYLILLLAESHWWNL